MVVVLNMNRGISSSSAKTLCAAVCQEISVGGNDGITAS